MVTHIVIFEWIAETTAAQVENFQQALDRLAMEMSDMVTVSHGPDLRFRDGNGDYALVATLRDRAAWDAYQADPRHHAFVHDFVLPLQASRTAIQI